jgi:uncharacterized Zn finger protein
MSRPHADTTRIKHQKATCPKCDALRLHRVLAEQGAHAGADAFGTWQIEYLLECACGHRWRHTSFDTDHT